MQINRKDVLWNFLATFLKTASSVILLPIILKILPTSDIGLWTIFVSLGTIVTILDFGFGPSFSRNITFIFSGAQKLTKEGFHSRMEHDTDVEINYGLLKATLKAMKYFYLRVSLAIFFILLTIGTIYLHSVLQSYSGNKQLIYAAWFVFIIQISFTMYTDYYEALLTGRGFIADVKKITIITQSIYLVVAASTLLMGLSLLGMFIAQLLSVLLTRTMLYRKFFDAKLKQELSVAQATFTNKEIVKTVFPNAIKGGINSLGSIFIYRAPIIIGSMYLPLKIVGTYGLTRQIFDIIYVVSSTYAITYFPQLSNNWVNNNIDGNKRLYVKSIAVGVAIFSLSVLLLMLFANKLLVLIGSKTILLSGLPLILMSINYCFTLIHGQSVSVILSKNYLPLYYVGFIGGIFVMLLTFINIKYLGLGTLGLVIPPLVVYLSYENWKWPYLAFKSLELNLRDFFVVLRKEFISIKWG